MRSEYGKLVYLLMDSAEPNIQDLLEFRCVRPLRTAYSALGECGLHSAMLPWHKWFEVTQLCVVSSSHHHKRPEILPGMNFWWYVVQRRAAR